MWVEGQPNGGVVSNPGQGLRNIYSALFITLDE
jgi:hypothetical protein